MWQGRFPGTIAGSTDSSGARQVVIDWETHLAHRVIWKLVTGEDPSLEIDHKNRDPGDNRWENLRLANRRQQMWNKGSRKDNLSGRAGIQLRGKRYGVRLGSRRLGSFATLEEALGSSICGGQGAIWRIFL